MSELKNQNDLLQQLKTLQAEKELLEKHVFVLNECLSVEELKTKISNLEEKQEMLVRLENLIERLRTETEPLSYLKSILKNKVEMENQINSIESKPNINLKKNIPKFDMNYLNTSIADCKSIQPQSVQITSNNSFKTDLISSQKLNDQLLDTIQTPCDSNKGSIVNDGSLDECTSILDQYDVVTDLEMINFSEENHSKTQNFDQYTNEIQDKQTATTSTYFDAEGVNVQLKKNEDVSVKESVEPTMNNLVTSDTTSSDIKSQLLETSTSQLFQDEQKEYSLYSDSSQSINNLLLKIPQLLLEQEIQKIDYNKVEENSNESLKNEDTSVSLKEDTKHNKTSDKGVDLSALKNNITNNNESVEQTPEPNQCIELPNTINHVKTDINSFNEMNLKLDILRGIYSLGFINPTVLQRRVIVHCLNGRDVIVFSGANNGRTMMFTIPLLQRIKTNLNECQALVLVPTRDLAVHIQKIITSVGEFLGVNVCIGGDNVPRKLSVIPHVVVGTPAGVSNMIKCKSLHTGCIHTVVLNKVDMMLTRNYTVLIEEIMDKLVKNKQVTLLTSDKLDHVLDMYMDTLRDPLVIINENTKEKENKIIKNLPKQFFLNIQEEWKINALCEVVETLNIQKAIIFCNTFDRAQKLSKLLQQLDYAISNFHMEMNAHERETQLCMFSSKHVRMIITTDPIKGSQFQDASWIINYDLPINPVSYLNRIANCVDNIKVLNLINENDDHTKSDIETHNESYMIQTPLNMIDLLQYY